MNNTITSVDHDCEQSATSIFEFAFDMKINKENGHLAYVILVTSVVTQQNRRGAMLSHT